MTLVIETRYIFIKKSPQIYFTCLKIPKTPPPIDSIVPIAPSLKKLRQVVITMNEQANLQPTLNKGEGDTSLIFLAPVVSKIKKKWKNDFLKTQKYSFEKLA